MAEDTEYVDDLDDFEVPSFGTSQDSYEEVSNQTIIVKLVYKAKTHNMMVLSCNSLT